MDRYYPVALTVPAGTAIAAPVSVAVALENNLLVDVEIQIPSGHSGFTGVRVLSSNQQILPWGNSSWIVADDYVRVFDWNEEIGSKAISVQGYNTDTMSHTFYLRFHIINLPVIAPSSGIGTPGSGGSPVGVTGGGGNPPTLPPPTLPPIDMPPLPLPPVLSPISGPGGGTPPPQPNRREQFILNNM